eukprot:2600990-Pleurochrysis_carterae.AAC.2
MHTLSGERERETSASRCFARTRASTHEDALLAHLAFRQFADSPSRPQIYAEPLATTGRGPLA